MVVVLICALLSTDNDRAHGQTNRVNHGKALRVSDQPYASWSEHAPVSDEPITRL
jgi:hypothetical protein